MYFRFIGDPLAGTTNPDAVEMYGVMFPLDEPVKVDDSKLAKKLAGNSHFEKVDGRAGNRPPPKSKAKATKAPAPASDHVDPPSSEQPTDE